MTFIQRRVSPLSHGYASVPRWGFDFDEADVFNPAQVASARACSDSARAISLITSELTVVLGVRVHHKPVDNPEKLYRHLLARAVVRLNRPAAGPLCCAQ